MEFHFFPNNTPQGKCFVLFCLVVVFRIKTITSIELIMSVSMKRNTIEFNCSNNWSSETTENKKLSLPSSLSFFVGRNNICYVQYWVFKKGGNICSFMSLDTGGKPLRLVTYFQVPWYSKPDVWSSPLVRNAAGPPQTCWISLQLSRSPGSSYAHGQRHWPSVLWELPGPSCLAYCSLSLSSWPIYNSWRNS